MNDVSKPTIIENLPIVDESTTNDLKFVFYETQNRPSQLSLTDLRSGSAGNVVPREPASISNNPYAFREQIVNGATVLYWGEFIDLSKPLPRYYGTSSGRITIVTLAESLNLTWDANVYVNKSNDLTVNPIFTISQPYIIQPFKEVTLEFTNCRPSYAGAEYNGNTIYYIINS